MRTLEYFKEIRQTLYLAETIPVSIGDRVVVATGMRSIACFNPAEYSECTVIDLADEMAKLNAGGHDFWCDRCLVVARVNKPASGCCGSSPCGQKDVPEVQTPNIMSRFYIEANE